jgi:hypothetical protein
MAQSRESVAIEKEEEQVEEKTGRDETKQSSVLLENVDYLSRKSRPGSQTTTRFAPDSRLRKPRSVPQMTTGFATGDRFGQW